MTIQTVIVGHGEFATGIRSSLQMLTTIPSSYYFVDFTEKMNEQIFSEALGSLIDPECDGTLFFTDLLGGTPYKIAVELSFKNKKYEVVTGCNIGSLLETSFNDYPNTKEYAVDIISISKKYTERFVYEDETNPENNSNNGI